MSGTYSRHQKAGVIIISKMQLTAQVKVKTDADNSALRHRADYEFMLLII